MSYFVFFWLMYNKVIVMIGFYTITIWEILYPNYELFWEHF